MRNFTTWWVILVLFFRTEFGLFFFVYEVYCQFKYRWLLEVLLTVKITWLPPHPGQSMELRKVDLIQHNCDLGRRDITSPVAKNQVRNLGAMGSQPPFPLLSSLFHV